MSGDSHGTGVYWKIFGALMVLTCITVAAAFLDKVAPTITITVAIVIAMIIAVVKGSLVASVFMHLKGEKPIIFWSLALTVIFFVFLMAIPVMVTEDSVGERIAPITFHYGPGGHDEESGEGGGEEGEHAEEPPPFAI